MKKEFGSLELKRESKVWLFERKRKKGRAKKGNRKRVRELKKREESRGQK